METEKMTTQGIEDAIVKRLHEDVGGEGDMQVRAFPDGNLQGFFESHPKGSALVQYRESRFTAPRAPAHVSQVRTLRFSVFVVRRNLKDNAGVYDIMDAVRASLTGFRIAGFSKMFPTSERFLDKQSGLWMYEMSFEFQGANVEL